MVWAKAASVTASYTTLESLSEALYVNPGYVDALYFEGVGYSYEDGVAGAWSVQGGT